jgi:penicillin-binding protein activator
MKLLPILLIPFFLFACKSPAKYVNPEKGEGIVSVGQINVQDWSSAANHMVLSLKASGVFGSPQSKRKVLMISGIENSTRQVIDTDLIAKKIRVALSKTGRVVTTTAVSATGSEDKAPKQVRELREDVEFKRSTVPNTGEMIAPQYSLSGKILQTNATAGKSTQSTFTFQMSLTDLKTGLAEWEDEVQISKLGGKSAIGW